MTASCPSNDGKLYNANLDILGMEYNNRVYALIVVHNSESHLSCSCVGSIFTQKSDSRRVDCHEGSDAGRQPELQINVLCLGTRCFVQMCLLTYKAIKSTVSFEFNDF